MLVIPELRSPNYVPGISGWVIRRDGTAEFDGVTVRGLVIANPFMTDLPPNTRVEIADGARGTIDLYLQDIAQPLLALSSLDNGSKLYGVIEGSGDPLKPRVLFVDPVAAFEPSYLSLDVELHSIFQVHQNHIVAQTGPFANHSQHPSLHLYAPFGQAALRSGEYQGDPALELSSTYNYLRLASGGINEANLYINKTQANIATGVGNVDPRLVLDQPSRSIDISTGPSDGGRLYLTDDLVRMTATGPYGPRCYVNTNQARLEADHPTGGSAAIGCGVGGNTFLYSAPGPYGPATVETFRDTGEVKLNTNGREFILGPTGIFAPGMNETSAVGLVVERYPTSGNELYAQTSTADVKDNIADLVIDEANKVLDINPSIWYPKPHDNFPGNHLKVKTGFIAEQVREVWPRAAVCDGDDKPIGVDNTAIIAGLLKVVQDLTDRIEQLETKVYKHER